MTQKVNFQGNPIAIKGQFPVKGEQAKPFTLVAKDLKDVSLNEYKGKRKVLNIFPSIDTDVCATSVRKFNELASQVANCVVFCISVDLPFAQARFCGAEGLSNVITLSTLRGWAFKKDYGVEIADGPLGGLTTRAVIILDENDTVIYSQLVDDIVNEPNYELALAALK